MNSDVSKKLTFRNILGRFGRFCPAGACARESCFVNHRFVSVRISVPRRFPRLPRQLADL